MRLTDTNIIHRKEPEVSYFGYLSWTCNGYLSDVIVMDGCDSMEYEKDYLTVYAFICDKRKIVQIYYNEGASFELSEIINHYKNGGDLSDKENEIISYINKYVKFFGYDEKKVDRAAIKMRYNDVADWYVRQTKMNKKEKAELKLN